MIKLAVSSLATGQHLAVVNSTVTSPVTQLDIDKILNLTVSEIEASSSSLTQLQMVKNGFASKTLCYDNPH